jgi:YrbI family 3-deoxy-D-manno-octulosonate 8-phosphate phosphatase
MVIFDIDGVMTDAGMYYTESGDEFKKFNAKDGMVVRRLKQRGIHTGIISHGFNSNLIQRRAERLHISHMEVSQVPKKETLMRWCKELNINPAQVCYIGDDVNDEDIMNAVGFSACPADAVDDVKNMVHVVLQKKGGEGCVRELIDLYI